MTSYSQKMSKLIPVNKKLITIVTISLCVTGMLCAWNNILKDLFSPKNFGVVEKGQIYRSGLIAPSLIKDVLSKHKIKTIIGLSYDVRTCAKSNTERQVAKKLGIGATVSAM